MDLWTKYTIMKLKNGKSIGYWTRQATTSTTICRPSSRLLSSVLLCRTLKIRRASDMQTEGKININNKKTSHKDKIKIAWKTILFYICQLTLSWLQVAAPFGDAIVRVEIICALFLRFQMHCNVPNYLSHRYIEGNRSKNQQLLLRIPE